VDLDQDQQAGAALGRASVLTPARRERVALATLTTVFFAATYFGVGWTVNASRARTLLTALDARIPFIAGSIWIYLALFPAAFLPLFVVRCPRLFRRTIAAYLFAVAVSVAIFASLPVTSAGLRVDPDSLDTSHFAPWAVSLLYRVDPPYNLFPSLHLSIAVLAGLSAGKASRRVGAAVLFATAFIAASICTVKQHFLLDAVGGVLVAAAAYAIALKKYEPREGVDPAYGRRGLAAFSVCTVSAYAGLYAIFLAGR
jgi:membrane-associated phospholipid phosphatase